MANLSVCKRCGGAVQAASPRATNKRFCGRVCYELWWNESRSNNVTRGEWAEKRYGPVPAKALAEVEKAWLAAMVDGEGCIGVYRSRCEKNRSGFKFQAQVTLANTNRKLIDRFVELTNCWATVKNGRNGQRDDTKTLFTVQIRRRAVREFLQQIMPYLVAKREQAENAIGFLDLLDASPMRTSVDHSIFDVFYERTLALNKKGR